MNKIIDNSVRVIFGVCAIGLLILGVILVFRPQTSPGSAQPNPPALSLKPQIIYKGTTFTQGYEVGVNTGNDLHNWVQNKQGAMCMAYPGNQDWGAVFITFGKSDAQAEQRAGQNLSAYQTLSFDLKGEHGGEYLSIGLKDKADADDGSERKYSVTVTNGWRTYTFPLSDFDTADLTQLYIVTEFVFEPETPAETVCFRNIQYLP
jgi:hypothetical protein